MKDTKKTMTFLVDSEGYLTYENHRARTLYEALYIYLEKDWDSSREALSTSLTRSADLLTMALHVRNDFEHELMEKALTLAEEVKEDGIKHPEEAATRRFKSDKKAQSLMGLLDQLLPTCTTSIMSWVKQLSDEDFSRLVETLKEYLELDVSPFHDVYSVARDSAVGVAVHVMRGLSPFDQGNLQLVYSNRVDPDMNPETEKVFNLIHTPDFVSTELSVAKANKVAKKLDLPIVFKKMESSKKSKKSRR